MSRAEDDRIERVLAGVFSTGTWLGSLLIGTGLVLRCAHWDHDAHTLGCMRLIVIGIALFILLPVLRVLLMAAAFMHRRDRTLSVIATSVLCIIAIAAWVGAHAS
jgi:uncharacterized membrane protein